jgi:N-dimethylarginine dimethylaminohydrolase
MLDRVDLERMRRQTSAIAEAFRSFGVRVHLFDADHAPPNLVFMRDLFFATEEGVIVGRMGAAQRAGEERFATSALAGLGVPILATVGGTGTFEGADALWLDSSTVILGVGFRTNLQGAETVSGILSTLAVRTVAVDLPRGVQHLLGAVTFLDRDLVAVHGGAADDALWQRLEAHGYECLVLPPDDELVVGRGMNLVALAPRKVLMPGGCPGIRRQLASRGVEAHEVELSEYLKAAGGLGCVTGILRREAIGPSLTDPDPLPLKRGHHDGNER